MPIESRELLDTLVATSDDAIIGTDAGGRIFLWNEAAARLLGAGASEAKGQSIDAHIDWGSAGKPADTSQHMERTIHARNGRQLEVSLKASPLHQGGMLYVLRDISAINMLERRVKDAQQYLDKMLDHIPDPIFMKDRQHRWIGGNKAFWDLLSGPPENFLGKSDYDFFPKEEAEHFWAIDDRVFAGEIITTEETLTRPGGETHVLSTKKASFTGEQGEFLVGVIRDISQIKQAEERLINYTRQLERSNQELEDFAHIASHDLKEPLRGLISQAMFVKEDYQKKLDEAGMKRLDRIVTLGKRMDGLIDELLYFARLGYGELAVGETDPNHLIDEIRLMLNPLLRECNARIVVPNPLPKITCDRPGMTEVLRNLITNAVKYNDKAERIVEIGFLPSAVSPYGPEKNVFYVKDNGIGIAKEHYKEVFRMFRRLQTKSDEGQAGTGAGLCFVKKIIDRCGGRIWIDSTIGKGSTFNFTLGPLEKPK